MHIPHAADRHGICACIHKTQQYLYQVLILLTYTHLSDKWSATLTLILDVHGRNVLLDNIQATPQRFRPIINCSDFLRHLAHQILRKTRQIADLTNETADCEHGCCF